VTTYFQFEKIIPLFLSCRNVEFVVIHDKLILSSLDSIMYIFNTGNFQNCTGLRGGLDLINSRMILCASFLTEGGKSPSTITLFSLYLRYLKNQFKIKDGAVFSLKFQDQSGQDLHHFCYGPHKNRPV
jgi:hypothetical protein